MKRNTTFSFWGFIISALILVIFAVQNAQEVRFKFIVWETHLSLSVLLIVAFLLGLIAGAVFSFRRNRFEQKQTKKDKEITSANVNGTSEKWDELEDIDINRD